MTGLSSVLLGILLSGGLVIVAAPKAAAEQPAASPAETTQTTTKPSDTDQGAESREEEAEEAKRLTELYLRNQSVFIRKGELMLELNSFYTRNSRQDLLTLDEGVAPVQDTRRFFDTTLIARYGVLTDGLELDLIAPVYVRGEARSDLGAARITQADEGLGDIRAAVRYQAWYERGSRPSLVVDVEGKSRTGGTGLTGTGTWSMGGGVTLIKTMDPVVFFGRIGYVHNIPSQARNLGDIIDYRLGMGFSLNDRVSFNIQLTGAYIGQGRIAGDGIEAVGGGGGAGPLFFSTQRVEMWNLIFTTTVMTTKQLFIEPFVGVALTEQSFMIIGLRIPYRLP